MSFFFIDDAPGIGSVAFQASATSIAATITCPTVQQGDVGVLFDFARDTGETVPSQTIPSGFTLTKTDTYLTSSGYRGTVSRKIFDGTESGSSLTGQDGSSSDNKVLLVFRPSAPATSIGSSTWLGELDTANPAAQLIAASGQQVPLIRLAVAGIAAGTSAFAAGTFDATVATSSGDLLVGYAVQNSAGSDDTVDMDDLTVNWLASGWLSVS